MRGFGLKDAKYAAYVKAADPVYTCRLVYGYSDDPEAAKAEILAAFDAGFPSAKDRVVLKFMTIAEYLESVRLADELNSYMGS